MVKVRYLGIETHTENALLVKLSSDMWVPKSIVKKLTTKHIYLPEWFCKKYNIVGESTYHKPQPMQVNEVKVLDELVWNENK
ncbi:hypothetical protein AVBRAN12640_05240 [Campylobacter sp. RM12640]|uniref:hypothetical protein n=1 Tax=unclassified Campylobacter TaxID=2593542 RepID=UPI003014E656|nr:hypothetical protein [Campylobacter sp. RM12640]MBZ7989156.1 hypothetical protein [Campylobacter sp. RM12635]